MEGNFEVVKSKKAPTKPQSQKLASQDRSKQRQLFEQVKREKEAAIKQEHERKKQE